MPQNYELTQYRIINLSKQLIWRERSERLSIMHNCHIKVQCYSSPVIGPGLVSTSPATTSKRDSARNKDKRGVPPIRPRAQHLASLPMEESIPFPASNTPVPTFSASDSSSRTETRGAFEITRSRCRCSGTRGRDPQCAWYHRSFLFSQWPILARHSSGPLGGIFKIEFDFSLVYIGSRVGKAIFEFGRGFYGKSYISVLSEIT